MGEFGVNARDGHYGEIKWVADMLAIFKENNMHWTYWTYKTVANYSWPIEKFRKTRPSWESGSRTYSIKKRTNPSDGICSN